MSNNQETEPQMPNSDLEGVAEPQITTNCDPEVMEEPQITTNSGMEEPQITTNCRMAEPQITTFDCVVIDGPRNSTSPKDTSSRRRRDSEKMTLLEVSAAECVRARKLREERQLRCSHALQALRALSNAALHPPEMNQELFGAIHEEDEHLFSDIPDFGQRRPKTRESRSAPRHTEEFVNTMYRSPPKTARLNPRTLVDINRPLTPRYDPGAPAFRKIRAARNGHLVSRYHGLSKGDATCIADDPAYKPMTTRRSEVEAARERERSLQVKPLTPQQLIRKRGSVAYNRFQEAKVIKVPIGFVPRAAEVPPSHGQESRERRDRAEQNNSKKFFRP